MVKTRSFAHVRDHLDQVIDEVCETNEPLVIRRRGHRPVVMMSKAEFLSMEETLHLLSSAANAQRLLKAGADVQLRNNLVDGELVD